MLGKSAFKLWVALMPFAYLISQMDKHVVVCSTPKIGTSFTHAWLYRAEAGPEIACAHGTWMLSENANQWCKMHNLTQTGVLYQHSGLYWTAVV